MHPRRGHGSLSARRVSSAAGGGVVVTAAAAKAVSTEHRGLGLWGDAPEAAKD